MTMRACLCLVALLAAWAVPTAAQPAAPPRANSAERTIVNLRGNLYLAQFDWRATVFLVTSDGIVVADPLSVAAASWMRQEFAQRFPGQPVRYVLHTHHHYDRAPGAAIFGTATPIAHRLFNDSIARLTGYHDVQPVKRLYDTREEITLGGSTVVMLHPGGGHARDMSVVYFPSEHVVFAVDHPDVTAARLSFGGFTAQEVSTWLDTVATLDVDLVVSGDGVQKSPQPFKTLQPFLHDVVADVTDGLISGVSGSALRGRVVLPSHRTNPFYGQREAFIDRTLASLTFRQLDVYGAAVGGRQSSSAEYCAGFDGCEPLEGFVPAGMLGLSVTIGQLSFAVEGSAGSQVNGTRTRRFYDDAVGRRIARFSALGGYRLSRSTRFEVTAVGGVTKLSRDTRGVERVKETLLPYGGRHPIEEQASVLGFTVGADLAIGTTSRFNLRVPVRFTRAQWARGPFAPSPTVMQVGVGAAIRLGRSVITSPGLPGIVIMKPETPAP
jgi:glyoxylase-like metal-dependent hydrolase (beta-lactamase superfamily II)